MCHDQYDDDSVYHIVTCGKYHVLALVVGLAFVVLYGALMLYLADFVPCGYINAIRNHMGWTAGILDVLYALRYLLRATLIAVFFSMILQRYLLQSFSVWWIFLPFLGITLYGASKSMEGRGRMFEFLFGWMVVPLILIVVFSVSNIDIGAIMQGITSQSEVSGVFKGAYAILLALSPLELQLYSCPCVKEKDRMGESGCLSGFYLPLYFRICSSWQSLAMAGRQATRRHRSM